jgi:bifunctional DNA-binding transcriptional regulator/antitoxin component of YhaV-PrlF toxin-antitoxin module
MSKDKQSTLIKTTKLTRGHQTTLPSEFLKRLGWRIGDTLFWQLDPNGETITVGVARRAVI